MASLVPYFYAASFEQANKSQLTDSSLFSSDIMLTLPYCALRLITHKIRGAKKCVGGK